MMQDLDEEEVCFDQAGLLDNKKKKSRSSLWCRSLVKIICLSLAFLSLGLCIAIPGPTLLDLGERVNTDTSHMALIFTARSVGYLLGAVIGGFLFDIFNKHLLLCSTLFLAALATAIVPWVWTLTVLAVMFSLQGVAMGVLDTGGNAFCVRIWGKKSSPYMQAMHFAFGIGAFIAPLLSQPFLSNVPSVSCDANNTMVSGCVPVLIANPVSLLNNVQNDNNSLTRRRREEDTNQTQMTFTTALPSTVDFSNYTENTTIVTTTRKSPSKPLSATDKFSDTSPDGHEIVEHLASTKNKEKSDGSKKQVVSTETTTKASLTDSNSTFNTNSSLFESVNTTSNESTSVTNNTLSPPVTDSSNTEAHVTSETTTMSISTTTALPSTEISTTTTTTAGSTTAAPTTTTTIAATTSTTTTKTSTTTLLPTTKSTTSTTLTTTTKAERTSTSMPTKSKSDNQEPDDTHKSDDQEGQSHTKAGVEATTSSENITMFDETTVESATKPSATNDIGTLINSAVDAVKHMSKIQFSYMIISSLLVINAIIFLVLYCYERFTEGMDALIAEREKHYHIQNGCVRIIILIVMFLFFLSYAGMETTFGGFIMTFAVEYMGWTKEQGAIVTAIFWGSLATGRGFSIFIAGCCKPKWMLIIDLGLVILGATMLSFVVKSFSFILWTGCLAIGLGMSSVFPTGLSWTEQYFRMTGKSTAVLVMGSALGQMTIPALTGYAIQNFDKMYLMYVVLTLSFSSMLLFILMQILASKCGSHTTLRSENGFLPLNNDEGLEMDGFNHSYGTSQDTTRLRLLPMFNDKGYDRLPQDAENEIEDLLS